MAVCVIVVTCIVDASCVEVGIGPIAKLRLAPASALLSSLS